MKVELKNQDDLTLAIHTEKGATLIMTPPIGADYWKYRVQLSDKQAIIGFPKFLTIGIGFQIEDDWNTNLPYTCETKKIFDHISHNKGDDLISDEDCLAAIQLIQEAAKKDRQPVEAAHEA